MKTLLFILATCLVAICDAQRRPPSYSLDDMPETSFDCRDKILGGYYADPETDCQMFHVCVKVPGVGVQNYRFLCPNDTAFDQESQICASWYDVDCEAALLYSDNFDLYRIGYVPSSPAIVASKATALPLGPSTAAPVRARQPFNSRQPQPQLDDEYYLQAGDTGDRRLQPKDVLRGSSSGNFFNQKKGREEEEEAVISKKKVAVRKFRKRPSQQAEDNGEAASTAAPTTYYSTAGSSSSRSTSGNTYLPRYNTIQRTAQTAAPAEAVQTRRAGFQQRPSTAAPATASSAAASYQDQPRDNYNTVADNYNYQSRQQQQNNYNYPSSTAAPRTNNYNYQAEARTNYNAPSPTSSTTLDKYNYQTVQRNGNSFPTTTIAPSRSNTYYNNDNAKGSSDLAGTTAAPLSETTFYQQRSRNAQRYDTFAPVTTYAPNAYSTRNSSPNTEYDSNGNTVPQRFNTGRDTSRASAGSTAAVTSAPVQAETYQRNNINQRGSANTFTTTTAKPAYTYYDEYETKSTGSSEEYNNYNPNNYNYQRTNYNAAVPATYTGNERANGESLKTAPSNNYGPSSFNSFANSNSAKPAAGASTSNDQSQYNYNTGSGNAEQYNNRESSYYTTKQESYNAVNASVQQAARNNYYSGDVTSRPSTNQQASAFSTKQLPRTTDDGSTSYDSSNSYRTTSRPRSSYNTNEVASTSVTSNSRSSYFTQTTVANTVTTQRPQYTQAAAQKQYTDAVRNQSPTFKGDKAATANNTASAINKTVPKTGDVTYDYAYYDETAPSEYEGLDPISDRHFGKNAESLKVARRSSK